MCDLGGDSEWEDRFDTVGNGIRRRQIVSQQVGKRSPLCYSDEFWIPLASSIGATGDATEDANRAVTSKTCSVRSSLVYLESRTQTKNLEPVLGILPSVNHLSLAPWVIKSRDRKRFVINGDSLGRQWDIYLTLPELVRITVNHCFSCFWHVRTYLW